MHNRSLAEWERELRKRLDGADLLGEAGSISKEETYELGKLIGALFRNLDWDRVKERILSDYPRSFAVYLVFQGVHGYIEGNFWSAVRDTTGIDLSSAQTSEWGQLFERIVGKLGVARFPQLGGHRYVGPILAHGGIPDSALPVFFDHFIYPWIMRTEYLALTAREFISERIRLSSAEANLDKPIIRFLRFGGVVAEDFADRCRDLVVKTAETGVTPSPKEVGLSPRVTERYRQWCEQHDLNIGQDKFRGFRTPILLVEPWGVGPSLYFAPQSTPLDNSHWQITWQVYADTTLLREWITPPHRMEGTSVPLRRVGKEYRVELTLTPLNYTGHDDTERFKRIWRFPGMTKDCPLMLFDAGTNRQIPSKPILPATRMWIYHYPSVELKARPPATLRAIEELPQLPWEWNTLRGQLIDLTDVEELIILKAGTTTSICEFAVYNQDQHLLEGGEIFPTDDDAPPLYIGTPPSLNIRTHGTSLNKWHVQICNEAAISPDVNLHLEDLDKQGYLSHRNALIMLRLDRYLGTSPLGNYRVTVRGALGHNSDLRFRTLPFLDMVGHDTLHLPEKGQSKIHFLLETRSDVEVSLETGARDCVVTLVDDRNGKSLYEVTAGKDKSNVPLQFSSRELNGKLAGTSLLVPIRRLRWMVTANQEESIAPKWRTTPLCVALETLEQDREPYLLVDLFGGTCGNLEVTVLLVNDEETILQEEHMLFKKGQSPTRFDLRVFLDTIRHSPSPFSLKLRLRGLPNAPDDIFIPLLFLTRGFAVEHAEVATLWNEDTIDLSLRWQPDSPLMHRFVRFWSVWRPWDNPFTLDLPDEAQGGYEISLPQEDLIPGKYLLEFGVRNPWLGEPPHTIRHVDEAVLSAFIPQGAVDKRLNDLTSLRKEGTGNLVGVLERAIILHDSGQDEKAHPDFQWCIDNLDAAGVDLILQVARCVSFDPGLSLAVRKKIARASFVSRTVDDYQAGQISEDAYREYLELLPRNGPLSSDTCEMLLKIDDYQLRLYGAQQLVQLGMPSGVQAVIEWVKGRELSETVAIELLGSNISLSVTVLKDMLPDTIATDLWEKFSRKYPHQVPTLIVRAGCWVRCVAGWGEIERIEGPEGQQVEEFVYAESKYLLYVLLRAHDKHNAERVLVNLDKKTVSFVNESPVYTCSECEHFSTQHYGLIISSHGPAAHTEKSPGLTIRKSATLSQDSELEFLLVQPQNPWA